MITADTFGIARRIKAIDRDYFIVYNYRRHRYEVHHAGQRENTLALVVPYKSLDARTLSLVRRSSRENAASYLASVEQENLAARKRELSRVVKNAERNIETIYSNA